MITIKGKVAKIKILKLSQPPLVRFTILAEKTNVNCLIVRHSLSFLNDVENGQEIAAGGHYNSRGQFVVEKYFSKEKSAANMYIESTRYPRKHACV